MIFYFPARTKSKQYCLPGKTKSPALAGLHCMHSAETMRFELMIPFWGIHTFQACSFNHSDKSPVKGVLNYCFFYSLITFKLVLRFFDLPASVPLSAIGRVCP